MGEMGQDEGGILPTEDVDLAPECNKPIEDENKESLDSKHVESEIADGEIPPTKPDDEEVGVSEVAQEKREEFQNASSQLLDENSTENLEKMEEEDVAEMMNSADKVSEIIPQVDGSIDVKEDDKVEESDEKGQVEGSEDEEPTGENNVDDGESAKDEDQTLEQEKCEAEKDLEEASEQSADCEEHAPTVGEGAGDEDGTNIEQKSDGETDMKELSEQAADNDEDKSSKKESEATEGSEASNQAERTAAENVDESNTK